MARRQTRRRLTQPSIEVLTPQGASDSSLHVAGYTVIEAADIGAAKSLVAGHPHFMLPGAAVEILEVMPMPGI